MQPLGKADESAPKRGYTIQRCSQTQGKADMYPSRPMRIQADSILSPLFHPARPRRITKKVIGREHPLRMRTLPMTSHVCLGESSACPVRDLEMDLQGNSPAIPSLHRWTICWFTCCAGRRPPRCRAAALCWFGSSRRRILDSGIGPFRLYPLPRRAAYRSWGNRS